MLKFLTSLIPLSLAFVFTVYASHDALAGSVRDQLLQAIFDEDVKKVRTLLSMRGVDVRKISGRWGGNLLLDAAETANYPIGKMLIERGLSVNTTDPWGNTPLILAVQEAEGSEDLKFVQLLVEKGANINHVNEKGLSAIDVAERWNQTECLKILKTYRPQNTALVSAKKQAHNFVSRLKDIGAAKIVAKAVPSDINPDELVITVANGWHYQPHQMRLQAAQNLWKTWVLSRTAVGLAKKNPDEVRIRLVDFNGNEVGGSRVWAGSLIWVKP